MAKFLTGRPAGEIVRPLEETLARASPVVENWDTRAALLWVLVATERFDTVEAALGPMLAEVHRSGSARGLVAAHTTLGLLKLRLGALPEADAAARIALRVLQEGDFAPGLAFAATVLADVAVEAGEPDEAQALLDLLPQEGWPAGVGTVLIPAARGRLRLAQGRAAEALADFETCLALFGAAAWGMETRETGYVHARSGAALALCASTSRTARASWPTPSWPMCACSGRRAHWGSRCGSPAWRADERDFSYWANRWMRSMARPRCSSVPTRLPSSVRLCAGPANAPRHASLSPRRSTSLRVAAPDRWQRERATSSRRPAPARDARGAPAWKR
jgi:hypothetical protein